MTSVSSSRPRAFRSLSRAAIGPIALLGVVAVVGDVAVVVPGLAVAVVDLHHAHAALHQPAGEQAGVGELAVAVQLRAWPAFRVPMSKASCASNCMRNAISSDAIRASSCSSRPRCSRCSRFICCSRSSCARCAGGGRWRLLTSRMIGLRIDRLVVDVRALVDAGQEAVAPQLRADDRLAGAEHDEAGQVLVLGAQAVGQPRAQAGPDRLHVAGVHHQAAPARGWGCRCTSSG